MTMTTTTTTTTTTTMMMMMMMMMMMKMTMLMMTVMMIEPMMPHVPMISVPPSSLGGFHSKVMERFVVLGYSSGPRGSPGLSEDRDTTACCRSTYNSPARTTVTHRLR